MQQYADAPRFLEPEQSNNLVTGTYPIKNLLLVKACGHDRLMTQEEIDEGYVPLVEYQLERAPGCLPEVTCVAVYRGERVRDPALEELARQYLEDDATRLSQASSWLDEHGDVFNPRREAA